MTTYRSIRAAAAAATAAALAVAFAGCAPVAERSIAVVPDQVAAIEFFEYPSTEVPDTVDRLTVRDPAIITEWMRAFTDMPLREYTPDEPDEFDGAQTQSSRLILTDGREIEITTIWIGPHDNVVLWPDATVWRTDWGSPRVLEAYADVAQIDEVSADELPVVVLPG